MAVCVYNSRDNQKPHVSHFFILAERKTRVHVTSKANKYSFSLSFNEKAIPRDKINPPKVRTQIVTKLPEVLAMTWSRLSVAVQRKSAYDISPLNTIATYCFSNLNNKSTSQW